MHNSEDLPQTKRTTTKIDDIAHLLDKLVYLYHQELLSFKQIEQKTGIDWWTIKNLFRKNKIKTISLSERARIKRERNYEVIYDLFVNKKLSLKEIYKRYKFSPQYVKQVLKDKGIEI